MTHIVNTKLIQSLCNLNLLSSIEERIGELFSFPQRTLYDLEIGDIA